jgi:hypothetical protein
MNGKVRVVAALALLLCAGATLVSEAAYAEEIDFDRIDKFESLTTGTLRVGAPPKTLVDDGERHVVILTIWDADAETKVNWRSLDGNAPKTTIIPAKASRPFKQLVRSLRTFRPSEHVFHWNPPAEIPRSDLF